AVAPTPSRIPSGGSGAPTRWTLVSQSTGQELLAGLSGFSIGRRLARCGRAATHDAPAHRANCPHGCVCDRVYCKVASEICPGDSEVRHPRLVWRKPQEDPVTEDRERCARCGDSERIRCKG